MPIGFQIETLIWEDRCERLKNRPSFGFFWINPIDGLT
jgi:hypothetical protein